MALDDCGIRGADIWVLYKYCCAESISTIELILNAVGLDLMHKSVVRAHIDKRLEFELALLSDLKLKIEDICKMSEEEYAKKLLTERLK